MSFCYIGIAKKCTIPSNEFLIHKCRNRKMKKRRKIVNLKKKCTSPANEFLLHKFRNNRKMKKCFFFKYENMYIFF